MLFMRRLRFSLRSLLLGVLAGAAAATLWHNFPAWRIERIYPGKTYSDGEAKFSPDGKWAVINKCVYDKETRHAIYGSKLCNIETGQSSDLILTKWPKQEDRTNDRYFLSGFSEDSHLLIAGCRDEDRTVYVIWDLQAQTARRVAGPPAEELEAVGLLWDDRHIQYALRDGTRLLFDLATNAFVPEAAHATHIRLSMEMDRLIMLDKDGSIRILDSGTKRELQRIIAPIDWAFTHIQCLEKNTLFVLASLTEHDEFEGVGTALRIDLRNPQMPECISGQLRYFSHDLSKVVLSHEKEFSVWKCGEFKELYRVPMNHFYASFQWSGDSKRIYSESTDTVYDAQSGQTLYQLPNCRVLRFSDTPDRFLVSKEGVLRISDSSSGEELQKLFENDYSPRDIELKKNGAQIYNYDSNTGKIEIWARYRPERWWGLAWLPEFWLTVFLTGAFLGSIYNNWERNRVDL